MEFIINWPIVNIDFPRNLSIFILVLSNHWIFSASYIKLVFIHFTFHNRNVEHKFITRYILPFVLFPHLCKIIIIVNPPTVK